jgi:hypothetical protein
LNEDAQFTTRRVSIFHTSLSKTPDEDTADAVSLRPPNIKALLLPSTTKPAEKRGLKGFALPCFIFIPMAVENI